MKSSERSFSSDKQENITEESLLFDQFRNKKDDAMSKNFEWINKLHCLWR